jgi:phosphate transport system substrate-binding protein
MANEEIERLPFPVEDINDSNTQIKTLVELIKNINSEIRKSKFRLEWIIQNPDIKIVAIDGVYPSVETVKNGSYPITTPLYAVTYRNNKNPNVDALIEWILSEEGQYIIEQTGYVGVSDPS